MSISSLSTERKQRVREAFARAAASYDTHGEIQQEIARGLLERVESAGRDQAVINLSYGEILEVGCGTGNLTRALRQRFPQARITAVDFCEAMLARAQDKLAGDSPVDWLLADGESLEFPPERFDLITSSSAVQWFDDPAAALERYALMLRPGGRLVLSLFGPQTFQELAAVLAEALPARPLPAASFLPAGQLEHLLGKSFECVRLEEQTVTRQYDSLVDLLRSIRHTGTTGGHWQGLFSRKLLERLDRRYRERFGGIPATYHVCYCTAQAGR